MTSIVSLPMYDAAPEALQVFWTGLRRCLRATGLVDVPDDLFRPSNLDGHWRTPDLLLSQTCGYPFSTTLASHLQLVGTPCYSVSGAEEGDAVSLIVLRRHDQCESVPELRGRRVAFNGRRSQSGYNALRALVAPHARGGTFFAEAIETGSHARSLQAVLDGRADVAAVDCVSFAMLTDANPRLRDDVRVLCHSDPYPGLPLVTARRRSRADTRRLQLAFVAACRDPALAKARSTLFLQGLRLRPSSDYRHCRTMEENARRLGYFALP